MTRLAGRSNGGATAVVVLGVAMAVASGLNFVRELRTLDAVGPPLFIFLVGVALSGAAVYAGVVLGRSDFEDRDRWTVAGWTVLGAVTLSVIAVLTVAAKSLEGRPVAEPWLDVMLSVDAGALAGFVSGVMYVRARRRARAADRASETLAFLNRTLRHEVLNDVQLITGNARALDPHVDDDGADSLATLREAADDLVEVIENVRQVANVHAGDVDVEPIDLSPVLSSVVDRVREAHPEATLDADVPEGSYVAATGAVEHVFRNLLDNAVEHGGDAPTVAVQVDREDDRVVVEVTDDGPGVPDDREESIFEPERGDTHGFGLHLVRTLAEGYGGSVRLEDDEPSGAAFVVWLPRADPPGGTIAEEAATGAAVR